jgi:hypothetical protein
VPAANEATTATIHGRSVGVLSAVSKPTTIARNVPKAEIVAQMIGDNLNPETVESESVTSNLAMRWQIDNRH